jgi:hypothetical protein
MRTLQPDFVIWHESMAAPILIYNVRRRRRSVWPRALLLTLAVYIALIVAVFAADRPALERVRYLGHAERDAALADVMTPTCIDVGWWQ